MRLLEKPVSESKRPQISSGLRKKAVLKGFPFLLKGSLVGDPGSLLKGSLGVLLH